MGESSESNAPFKFEIKGAPDAGATAVVGGSDVEDAAGNPPLQAFRFKLKTRDGFAQPAVIAVAQPRTHAKVQTGTLTVKGALAGEAFFLLNARTHQPVKVSEGSKVKTTITVASGVMFILGCDRTATFEKLPAGHYQVVFPPEQTEGAKHEQPQIKANAHGAHVVDIKDFVDKGAICEIEVPPGGTPTLELTLSADGTAQVCCQEKAMCDTQEHIGIGQTAAGYIPDLLRNIDGARGYDNFLNWLSPILKQQRPAFLKLSNGASVSYGDILAMAGDFFLEFEQMDGFEWSRKDDPTKTTHQEIDGILREYHKKLGNLAYTVGPDARTGAHFFNKWFDAGRVMNLALKNFPHFGFDALAQWLKYHNDAIALAVQGRKYYGDAAGYAQDLNVDPDPILVEAGWDTTADDYPLVNNLIVALKHNAFGDHFLSDLFSSGHMRVARRAMYDQLHDADGNQWVVPLDHIDGSQDVDLCSIVSGISHDEDGKTGLWCNLSFGGVELDGLGGIGAFSGPIGDFMAWGDGHLFDHPNRIARDLAYYAVALSVRDVLIASATGQDPRQYGGYWDPVGGSGGPAFAALRLVPRPYPPNTGWSPGQREDDQGHKWNHYPLAMPNGDGAQLEARYDAFKVALQTADPAAPDEQNWFRKIKVSDPLQYFGLAGEYLSETVGTNLLPTARAEYYDLRSFAMNGEPHWYGTPASAWRDQEFTRLMRRYIAYKMA